MGRSRSGGVPPPPQPPWPLPHHGSDPGASGGEPAEAPRRPEHSSPRPSRFRHPAIRKSRPPPAGLRPRLLSREGARLRPRGRRWGTESRRRRCAPGRRPGRRGPARASESAPTWSLTQIWRPSVAGRQDRAEMAEEDGPSPGRHESPVLPERSWAGWRAPYRVSDAVDPLRCLRGLCPPPPWRGTAPAAALADGVTGAKRCSCCRGFSERDWRHRRYVAEAATPSVQIGVW